MIAGLAERNSARADGCGSWRRQRVFEAAAQLRRCGLFQRGAAHGLAHGAERGELFVARRAACRVRLDLARMPGIELAVDQRMQ